MDPENINFKSQSISKLLDPFSIYHGAPELLAEAMIDLHKLTQNHKQVHGEDENYKFFERIEKAMRFAWNYLNDLSFIYKENQVLKFNQTLTMQGMEMLKDELAKWKVIEAEILRNSLDQTIEVVKAKIETELK